MKAYVLIKNKIYYYLQSQLYHGKLCFSSKNVGFETFSLH